MRHHRVEQRGYTIVRRTLLQCVLVLVLAVSEYASAAKSLDLASCGVNRSGDKRTISGLFRVHVICDRLLFEIPPELFNRDMLFYTEFSQLWATDSDIVPGTVADSRMMRWHRLGNTMHLKVIDRQMRADNRPNLDRGVEASQLGYLVRSFEIMGEGAGGAPIVDATPLFAADAPAFAIDLKRRFRMVGIDPNRSYIESVKAFHDNIRVSFYQTWLPDPKDLFRPPDPDKTEEQDEPQPSLQFLFSTNILLLPSEPLRGRYWDTRVGYFRVSFDDYGTELPWRISRGFIMRYRLDKKDPSAPLSEPIQPIVFYVSREVPDRWRSYIKRGVEDWQTVFEAAGFKRAIVARDAPTPEEDPDWDPEDARYSVIRWVPSARQKALGPSLVDPRSGEVVSSHLILWHDILRLVESWYISQVGALDPRAAKLPLPDEITGELLRYVVSHELGHALGLRHNFKAASAYSVQQLRDPEWTRKWGTSASIMSYGRLNYVAQPGDGAALLPRFGPYDFFAIDWGYRPMLGVTPAGEWTELDRMAARQIEEPMLRFGGEDEAARLDPTVTTYVLGSDPIAAADLGLRNVDRVMDILIPAATRLGRGFNRLAEIYEALVTHRHRQLLAVARLVGGVEETRYQGGRRGPPFTPVSAARARAAVQFLAERGFATPTRLLDREVLRRVGPEGGLDPLQGSNLKLIEQLVDPGVFQRLAEATLLMPTAMPNLGATAAYMGSDLLRDLNDCVFEELGQNRIEIGFYRRELQRNYVHLLVSVTESKPVVKFVPEKGIDAWWEDPSRVGSKPTRAFTSELATASRESRLVKERPSEFRAAVLGAMQDLSRRLQAASTKTRDRATAVHLSDLLNKLPHPDR